MNPIQFLGRKASKFDLDLYKSQIYHDRIANSTLLEEKSEFENEAMENPPSALSLF